MEAAAAGRGGSLSMPSSSSTSQSARKEWRAVSEHSLRNTTNEELELGNLGQSDDRTIYEQGSGPPDVDFCSITMDGNPDNDLLQQRMHSVARQREELQQMEIELRAQLIAQAEIMEMQSSFDAQIKDQVNAAAKLKEKLQEREHAIHELEMNMEEKDRELRAIKIDNEAAWAKEDLLREQNKELATFRRERDNSEAERIQHLKQICELQEHIQEKDRQFLELEEQNRAAQENILYRDEQLREAQAWCARLHETMQTEFISRTENFNNCWLGLQRQFADMERHHLQTIQQLQIELGEAREKSGVYTDESRIAHADVKDVSQFVHNNGNQFSVHEGGSLSGNSEVLPNGNAENITPFISTGNASHKTEYPPGVPLVPSSLFGMGAYLPSGQMTALHPFVMHQQGVPQSIPSANSHVNQSQLGHFQQIPAISSHQQWQNQQAVSGGSQLSNESQYLPPQTEENLLSSGAYEYELTANGHVLRSNYLDSHINPIQEPGVVVPASNEAAQVLETNDNSYLAPQQTQPSSEEGSGKFHEGLRLDSLLQSGETQAQEETTVTVANHSQGESLTMKPQLPSDTSDHLNSSDTTASSVTGSLLPEVSLSTRQTPNSPVPMKITEPVLLDERSLLACIVRAIPAGSSGQIRISSTLPNRLGKMLAPLHWHDYKKIYGKLDDFVSSHSELFVIEGDFVHLREGAQEIISATAAVAKVAAAAAASAPYSSVLPSVAVTPMAQNQRLKKVPSIDTKSTSLPSANLVEKSSQLSTERSQHSNGVGYNIVQGLSNVKILSKPKDSVVQNGFKSDSRPGHSSIHMVVANGLTIDRTGVSTYQNQGSSNGRHGTNFAGKNSGRTSGAAMTSRK